MNSFDEYHGEKNRQRMKQEAEDELVNSSVDDGKDVGEKSTIASKLNNGKSIAADNNSTPDVFCIPTKDSPALTTSSTSDPTNSSTTNKNVNDKGKLMELFEVQLLVLSCIGLDILFSVAELIMTYNTESFLPLSTHMSLLRAIQSFTGFTLFFFLLEICTLMITFKGEFFVHVGYLLDTVIVATCIFCEIDGWGKEIRMLNFLRVWRLIRLVQSMMSEVRNEHEDTKSVLRLEQSKVKEAVAEKAILQDSLKRELEARRRVETMLRGYKDEVETLSEALKIAAIDVAEAAQQQLMEDDGVFVDDEDDEFFDDGSEGKKKKSQGSTFVVNSDGTFEKR
mmetsp:Transcript_19319/g.35882  ORF Transcript_19319/g.35882 Transcript_19319/m.35882 type:complete len:338 (+) Transcript_19319:56-1069(+)|eukprot:CAMPEP_0182492982 /NCGR_PEP_ID=MMETSP1321-20130603/2013_1 /TAXON_ID=91990 /ORGANISM="Bolidomonas sp., Strain RCC1657" /LENGTH=337 /DNA_ID=CAMNT_0024695627 /DNA_START=45 /DNA_END=1061 /DNA_ORIENTATION=+